MKSQRKQKNNNRLSFWIILIVVLVLVVPVVGGFTYEILKQTRTYTVTGSAMAPTLTNGEQINAAKNVLNIQSYDIIVFKQKTQN